MPLKSRQYYLEHEYAGLLSELAVAVARLEFQGFGQNLSPH
jgi:hypothetical protein